SFYEGINYGLQRAKLMDDVARRTRLGIPSIALGQAFAHKIYNFPRTLGQRIALLRRLHFGPFQPVSERMEEVPLPPYELTVTDATQEGNVYRGRPVLRFHFREPRLIKCICVRYQLSTNRGPVLAVLRLGHRADGE